MNAKGVSESGIVFYSAITILVMGGLRSSMPFVELIIK